MSEDTRLTYAIDVEQIRSIEKVLLKDLVKPGIDSVILVDKAGNIIAEHHSGNFDADFQYLAVLAAGNYGAVASLAKIVGEEEFSLLFHKGKVKNIHFSKILTDYFLLSIFGSQTSLGFARLKVAEAIEKIEKILVS